jgi:hypothetical protein
MKKITLFALLLIGLGITTKVNAQDLVVTNNTSCAIDITFSSVDQGGTCNIASVGPTTVNAYSTFTIPGPLANGVIYKAQGKVGPDYCNVWDGSTNGPPACTPPGSCAGLPNTCTISTTACGSKAPTLTLTSGGVGSNATLVIN